MPLSIVLLASLIKELLEDKKRHSADNEVNSRPVKCYKTEKKRAHDRATSCSEDANTSISQAFEAQWRVTYPGSVLALVES